MPKRTSSIVSKVCLLLALLSPALAGAQVSSDEPVFRVGDQVRIQVLPTAALFGLPELPLLSGTFDIGEDGTVIHPLYRDIRIAGMSHQQAESAVRQVLSRYEAQPRFVVEPLFRIPVRGEVTTPGVFPLPPYATLAQAVMAAGGAMATADLRRTRLLRDGQTIMADLSRPDNPLTTLRVRSGDQIIVDRRSSIWRDRIEPVLTGFGSVAAIVLVVFELTGREN